MGQLRVAMAAAADQLKMEDLDHEAYETENLQDTSDYPGDNGADDGDSMMEDPELEAIKARVREMEEEAEKLKMLQSEVEKQISSPQGVIASPLNMSIEDKMEVDGRSVFVGNVSRFFLILSSIIQSYNYVNAGKCRWITEQRLKNWNNTFTVAVPLTE